MTRVASVLALLVPAGLAAWMFIRVTDQAKPTRVAATAVEAQAQAVTFEGKRQGSLTITRRVDGRLVAPSWSGVVTAVRTRAGDTLRSLDAVVAIDGVDRLAFHSPQPFHRRLVAGDKGPDVIALQAMLGKLDLLAEGYTEGVVDKVTAGAISRLAKRLGTAGTTTGFDPGWIVYLPEDSVRVAQWTFRVGSPSPSPGADIATLAPVVVRATAAVTDGGPSPTDAQVALLADQRFDMTGTLEVAAPDLDRVGALAGDSAAPGDTSSPAGEVKRDIVLVRKVPVSGVLIPSSALSTGEQGQCVWVRTGEGAYQATKVDLLDELVQPGTAALSTGIGGQVILANPSELDGYQTCR